MRKSEGQEEPTVQEISEARVKASLITKRNDDRINSHNCVMVQHWRTNVDLQAIVDTDQCIRYMAKYATKGEPISSIRDTKHCHQVVTPHRRYVISITSSKYTSSWATIRKWG